MVAAIRSTAMALRRIFLANLLVLSAYAGVVVVQNWLFWGDAPDGWTILGALIIVVAGLYVWMREARAMQRMDP